MLIDLIRVQSESALCFGGRWVDESGTGVSTVLYSYFFCLLKAQSMDGLIIDGHCVIHMILITLLKLMVIKLRWIIHVIINTMNDSFLHWKILISKFRALF